MKNFKTTRNIVLIAISAICLGQVIISCSTSTCPVASSYVTKAKSLKGYYTGIKSIKNKSKQLANNQTQNEVKNDLTKKEISQKNKTSVIDHNNTNYSDNPIENENNEELDLITSNKNAIVLPRKNIYQQIKSIRKTTSEQNQEPSKKFEAWEIWIVVIMILVVIIVIIAAIASLSFDFSGFN